MKPCTEALLCINGDVDEAAIRRHSEPSAPLGGKAFSPKFAVATECRRKKNFGRMIYRQNHFKSFCHEMILPKLSAPPLQDYSAFAPLTRLMIPHQSPFNNCASSAAIEASTSASESCLISSSIFTRCSSSLFSETTMVAVASSSSFVSKNSARPATVG